MENKKVLIGIGIIVLIFATLSSSLVQAAPATISLVFNDELKECKTFWPGDEFVWYDLPEEWKDYPPQDYLEIDSIHDVDNITKHCSEIGYTYTGELKVEGKQIRPYYDETPMFYLAKYFPFILISIVLLLAAIIIYAKLRTKS
jgi:hypothetical protein